MMERYDSYKDSSVEWIGEIPSHWGFKKFTYFFQIQKGKLPKELTEESFEKSLPYLSMEVLRGGEPLNYTYENDGVKVEKDDIGLLWDGSNSGEVVKINQNGVLSSTVSLISIRDPLIQREFSYYLLKFYENDFKKNTIGMGIPHVNGNHVKESKILLPPLSEQSQIVQFLDEKTSLIDSLIEKTKRKIELLKEERTSLINHTVTKGLNPNVEMKDSGVEWIGEIPSHWGKCKIKHLSKIISKGTTPSTIGREILDEGPIYYIKIDDFDDYSVSTPNKFIDEITQKLLERSSLQENDILVVITGSTTGKTVILPKKCIPSNTNQNISFVRLKDNKKVKFTWYWLFSEIIQTQVSQMFNVSTLPSLSMEDLGNIQIPQPPLSEQEEIIQFLDEKTSTIDKTIELEVKRIDYLKEYRQSLISEVVTGKIKVITDE